jgi:hypothetical protein
MPGVEKLFQKRPGLSQQDGRPSWSAVQGIANGLKTSIAGGHIRELAWFRIEYKLACIVLATVWRHAGSCLTTRW